MPCWRRPSRGRSSSCASTTSAWPTAWPTPCRTLAGWLYDDELATSYIKYEDDFAFLRRAIETDYFERLIEDAFLRSDHRCLAEVVPVSGDDDAWEEERLRAVRGTLSAQERLRRIAEDEVRLRRLQEAPDSPDALATLPHLGVADIAEAPKEHAYGLAVGAAVPCLVHEVPTRGIAYLYRYFDLSPVAFDELPYAGTILAMMLGKLPTASHTAAEIDTLVNGRLGNFGASCVVFDPADPAARRRAEPPEGPVVRLRVSSSALDENAAFLSELVREIIFETDFSDTDRIRDRLVQRRISMEQAFAASGNSFALARVGSYYRSASAIADELDGIGFYRFLVELLDRFEERREGLGEKLAELCGRIVSDERCLLSFAGDKASLSRFWDAERPSVERRRALASSAAPRLLRAPEPQQRNEAFVVPTDVCYAAMGYNLAEPADNRQLGTWLVACRALTFDYLCGTRCA